MSLRTNKILIIIFTSSLIVYLLSCFGLFDGLSLTVDKALYNALGYTNKWSKSFGPPWFLGITNNIASLGSKEIVLLFSIFFYFYFLLSKGKLVANNFAFTVGVGVIVILTTKSITGVNQNLNLKAVLIESLSNFPSGHTFIATVMYLSIAKHLNSSRQSLLMNKYLFVSASIMIVMVGLSRFIGNGHTVTEVIAGWSLGLCWFTFAQMFLALNHTTIFSK